MNLLRQANLTASLLLRSSHTLVLAESCTAGLVASALAATPGISTRLAGSFVVYQEASKRRWLGLEKKLFQAAPDACSREVAEALALAALRRTPHATVSVAITGRLGPSDEPGKDGRAWLACAYRSSSTGQAGKGYPKLLRSRHVRLDSTRTIATVALRHQRQKRAAIAVLEMVRSLLNSKTSR